MSKNPPKSIFEKALKSKSDVSLSFFSYLFSEIIKYLNSKEDNRSIQEKLNEFGHSIGQKVYEYYNFRDQKLQARKLKIKDVLLYIYGNIWQSFFGSKPEALDKSVEEEDEYRIYEKGPITNRFLASKSDPVNCADFIGGILEGMLYAAEFPAKVDAIVISEKEGIINKKVAYIIKFKKSIVERDNLLGKQ